MSTYPVDIKSYNITTANTHTVFDGPGRILAVSFAQPANVAVGTITLLDNAEQWRLLILLTQVIQLTKQAYLDIFSSLERDYIVKLRSK